jgi:hypothetical protein
MVGPAIFVALILAQADAGTTEPTVRERETELARALRAKDRATLSGIVEGNFNVHVTCGGPIRSFSTEVPWWEWIDNAMNLPVASYKAVISEIDLLKAWRPGWQETEASMAYVRLIEIWTIGWPGGGKIEKRLRTMDSWVKRQGMWRLAGRVTNTDPGGCNERRA